MAASQKAWPSGKHRANRRLKQPRAGQKRPAGAPTAPPLFPRTNDRRAHRRVLRSDGDDGCWGGGQV